MTAIGSSYNYTNSSIANGNYLATFYCNDSANNVNKSISNNFTLDTVLPNKINFSTAAEIHNSNFSRANIVVNITATDASTGIKNVTIRLYNSSTNLLFSNTSTNSNYLINYTGLSDGV